MKKMKSFMLGLLAATGASSACLAQEVSGTQAAQLPDADPALWVVRDADTIVYLFGAFQMHDGKADWFNDEVRQAFDASQELVLEVDTPHEADAQQRAATPLLMKYAVDPQGRGLSSRLTPEQYTKLYEALAAIGVPSGVFDRFDPWFASMMLSGASAQKFGLKPEHGAERVLRIAAAGRKMELSGVLTLERHIQMVDAMSQEQQLKQLRQTLDGIEEMDRMLPRLLAAWNAGDSEGVNQLMDEVLGQAPELRRALLADRNRISAEWIEQRLEQPGTVFMSISAAHLAGPDSVQAFLKQRNIEAQRVPQQTPEQ